MAIGTYAELLSALANITDRADMTTRFPEHVALCEAQLNRDLRVRQMLVRADAEITDEYSTVPTDFMGVRTFTLDGKSLTFVDQADLVDLGTAEGRSTRYSIVGQEIRYYPPPAAGFTAQLTYWARIPALSTTNTTNWLLTSYPDAYLYGSLVHAAIYLRDADLGSAGGQGYQAAIRAIRADDENQTFGDRRRLQRRSFT
jgi:hypothetical protein